MRQLENAAVALILNNPRLVHEKYHIVRFATFKENFCHVRLFFVSIQDACYTVAVLQPQIESPQRMSTCNAGSV